MSEQLKTAIARIFFKGEQGIPVGVGFLVSGKHVLTCAHVVTQALGLRELAAIPDDYIYLDFPFVAPDRIFHARVVCWQPREKDDIAVLEVSSFLSPSAIPVRLIAASDFWGHRFRAFGFPVDYERGVWTSGVLRQGHVGGWIQIEAIHVPGHRVVQGFSGTPVWDEQLDGVVGMVVEADRQASTKAAYIIPTALLVQAWPSLGQQAIPPCPYRGLFAFRESDEPYFFGRETYISQFVEAVQKKPFTAIIGPSGSGKSSVVFAGLVPRLSRSGNWIVASFRPGRQPFRALVAALMPLLELQMSETDRLVEINKLSQLLQKGELTLSHIVERIVEKHGGVHLLFIVDQFEELYTLCPLEDERQQFLDLLLSVRRQMPHEHSSNFQQVITLRADFLGYALSYRPFADALQHADLKLGPMTRQELRDAIKRPAEKLRISVDEGLVERILATVHKEPGNLPLLEFALTLLWQRQHEGKLTLTAYEEIGGVEQSLAAYAEEIYERFDEEEQQEVQQIFVQLVRPGEGTEDTRRLATRAEIGEERWKLVPFLSDTRLVISGRDWSTGNETLEVVHETLIREWKRLRGWMENDREFRLWQERLRGALGQWKNSGKDKDAFLRGTFLEEAMKWMALRPDALGLQEQAYVEASQQHQLQELQRLQELHREVERGRRAEESERMKDNFLLIASHELRTPLTSVQGYLELLGVYSHTLDDETKGRFLTNARRATEELVLLMGTVMDTSHIDLDQVRLTFGPVQVAQIVRIILEILEPVTLREERPIEMRIADDLYIWGDDLRLRQILLNLIGNVLKHTPETTRLEIDAEKLGWDELHQRTSSIKDQLRVPISGQFVVIAIRDWGPGIALEEQAHIFGKFKRLTEAISSKPRGAGLGLYLCRYLTEAMSGHIWMESTGIDNEGSTFFVALPFYKEQSLNRETGL